MEFAYKELKVVYDLFLQNGYRFSFFGDYNSKGRVFLRHDVDCSITMALEMANFEAGNGLTSTFFIQPDNDFYNPLSQKALENLSRIAELGHKIGLHISPSNCQNQEDLVQYIDRTYNYFSGFFPVDRIFSFHRPGSFDGWRYIEVPGFVNTYHSKYFKEIFYFSDSNRREFISSDLLEAPSTGKSIQFLTHPIWWSEEGASPKVISDKLFRDNFHEIRSALRVNIRLFANLLKD
jgi:hypothetical protein